MSNTELIKNKLEEMGYKPQIDSDGDLYIRYQMKTLYFQASEEENFAMVLLPQFIGVDEENIPIALTVCNKVNRQIKMVKLILDSSLESISANCEFYFANEDSLELNLKKSIVLLGIIRSTYHSYRSELEE